ncbi:MAG: substrate-binding domain-containing protein, partial [Opitutae bacterium]
MKNRILTVLVTVVTFCLFGCGGDDSGSKGVIAYTPQTLSNPFFRVIADNIRAEAEKNGYEVLVVDPDMDVKKQSDQIDDFIAKNVVAIVLVPVDRMSIGPAVKQANAAGIPVFTVDAKCAAEGAKIEGHVGTDNYQGGELAGQAMIQELGEEGGKVLILDLKKDELKKMRFLAMLDIDKYEVKKLAKKDPSIVKSIGRKGGSFR